MGRRNGVVSHRWKWWSSDEEEEPTGSVSIKRKLICSLEEFPSSRGRGETLEIRWSRSRTRRYVWRLQLCLPRKLQKCFVDSDTSPPPSAQRWVDADWTVFRQLVFILMLSCWAEWNSLGLDLSPSTGGKEKRSRQPQVKVMKQWWGGGRSQQAACPENGASLTRKWIASRQVDSFRSTPPTPHLSSHPQAGSREQRNPDEKEMFDVTALRQRPVPKWWLHAHGSSEDPRSEAASLACPYMYKVKVFEMFLQLGKCLKSVIQAGSHDPGPRNCG